MNGTNLATSPQPLNIKTANEMADNLISSFDPPEITEAVSVLLKRIINWYDNGLKERESALKFYQEQKNIFISVISGSDAPPRPY